MSQRNPFLKFGKVLRIRGIFGIISLIYSIFYVIVLQILPRFGIYFGLGFLPVFGAIAVIFALVNILIAILLLVYANRAKSKINHELYTEFYSQFLISFILAAISFVFLIIVSTFLPWIFSYPEVILVTDIALLVHTLLMVVQGYYIMSSWSKFTQYTNSQQMHRDITSSSNLLKNGYTIVFIKNIISVCIDVFNLLIAQGISLGYYLRNILGWSFLILSFVFVFTPLVLIMGDFRLGSSIQSESFGMSEPTLDGNYISQNTTTSGSSEVKTCPNCGVPNPPNARFCERCGNSL